MKRYLLPFCLFASLAFAKDRTWQDSTFLGMVSSQNGAIAMPVGGAIIAAPIRSQQLWFRANGLEYCLHLAGASIPNLTVNGHTKIAIEGRNVHILDDDGKDWKLIIVSKVAPKEDDAH